jgi:hypothetical protein
VAVTWNLLGNRSLDVHEVIIAPELRSDERGSYRYVCIAAWGTLARKQANTGIERTIADRTIKAALLNDFRCYDQPQGQRIIQRGTNTIEWLRADNRWIRQDRVTAADDAIGWQRETVSRDLDREIQECIDRYLLRAAAKGYLGDKRGTTLNLQVGAGNADAHETDDGGVFSSTTTTGVTTDSNTAAGTRFNGGHWFSGVTIPSGSTINSATAVIVTTSTTRDDPNINIYCEAADSPGNFATTADVTSRARTTANTSWVATGIGTSPVTSPDFTTAVQEVVDRAGWASGNNLTMLFDGKSDVNRSFRTTSYDGTAADAAKLDIDYTAPAGGTTRRRDLLLLGVGA